VLNHPGNPKHLKLSVGVLLPRGDPGKIHSGVGSHSFTERKNLPRQAKQRVQIHLQVPAQNSRIQGRTGSKQKGVSKRTRSGSSLEIRRGYPEERCPRGVSEFQTFGEKRSHRTTGLLGSPWNPCTCPHIGFGASPKCHKKGSPQRKVSNNSNGAQNVPPTSPRKSKDFAPKKFRG